MFWRHNNLIDTAWVTCIIFSDGSIIVNPPEDTIAVVGDDVIMTCVVAGYPHPFVFWYWGETRLMSPEDGDFEILANGSLRLISVNLEQSGEYTCAAQNTLNATMASAYLTVMGKQC